MPVIELLNARTPSRPYCSTDLTYSHPRRRDLALRHPYIQVNAPWLKSWIVVDIDREGLMIEPGLSPASVAAVAWEDAGLPPPSWICLNPANGHGHVVYGLHKGAHTQNDAEFRFFAAVQRGLRRALGGDIGYADLLTKNPLHPTHRTLQFLTKTPLYELGELAEHVDLSTPATPAARRLERSEGAGRNVSMFDQLRFWAYKAVAQYRRDNNENGFTSACLGMARMMNGFAVPLCDSEIRHIARSVGKWTYRHYTGQGGCGRKINDPEFIQAQRERGKLSGKARLAASEDKRSSAVLMHAKGMSKVAIATELGVHKNTVLGWLPPKRKKRNVKPRKPA